MPRFCLGLAGPRVTTRPQVINGPASPGQQVCIGRLARSTSGPFCDVGLAGPGPAQLWAHVEDLAEHRQFVPGVAHAARRLWLTQKGQQLADLAQRVDRLLAHTEGDPFRCTEQIPQHRHLITLRLFEQESRAAAAQRAVADLRHLQARTDRRLDTLQQIPGLELPEKITEITVFHCVCLECAADTIITRKR